MGWTSYHASNYNKQYKVDVKKECDALFGDDVVKSAMVGSTYYAAIKGKGNDNSVFAVVVLTHVDNNDYYNFSYKDIGETSGPSERKCPVSIIKLLSPTDSEWANNWRADCLRYAENKKSPNSISKLPVGARIKFKWIDGDIVLIKRAPAYQFKNNWWQIEGDNRYFGIKQIPADYEVLSR